MSRQRHSRELGGYLAQAMKEVKHSASIKMIALISLRFDEWIADVKSGKIP